MNVAYLSRQMTYCDSVLFRQTRCVASWRSFLLGGNENQRMGSSLFCNLYVLIRSIAFDKVFLQIKTTNSSNLRYDSENKMYKKLFFQDIDDCFSVERGLIDLLQSFEIVVEEDTIRRIQDSGGEMVMLVIDCRS